MLFSDIEGSTALLSRLGPAYADALSGQRRVLRAAWSAHKGREMGTEGDSFFVAFRTAGAAVAAAVQAQRGLAEHAWPRGEQVRVRMGVHTGSPEVYDDGYVGLDVHRAARIAGAAHGGQVLLSEATATLATAALPDGVALRDLGSYRLKTIARDERLFQLIIDGLASEFGPVRSLGAASSLPRPTTAIVGRDGEVAELTTLLESGHVHLLTLTGPGGSGKTRLAIDVAHRLVERFPDGVHFVPLAAVTTADVMWTSIAEVLNVPPEERTPPQLFEHLGQQSPLVILDNLEQVVDADTVVAALLREAPKTVLMATSRRPLNLTAEHQHPVPPLELPDAADLGGARASGAVQLFTQRAQAVKPTFRLDADNAADVAAVCRRLDGLPLAIELAAARTRLLSPHGLLARLHQALDIKATDVDRPDRQRTLRDTIDWSCGLLDPAHQAFFRRLGVFAGGADLSAITALASDVLDGADPLDHVAHLMDASLVVVEEDPDGEPRVRMLETIREFARDTLREADELDELSSRHADYWLGVIQALPSMMWSKSEQELVEARRYVEYEHENVRAALTWSLRPDDPQPPPPDRFEVGLQLCAADMCGFWAGAGYVAEGRRWLERVIAVAGDHARPEIAYCLSSYSWLSLGDGEPQVAVEAATRSVQMNRRLEGQESWLSLALVLLGRAQLDVQDPSGARRSFEEAVTLAEPGSTERAIVLRDLAVLEEAAGDLERALALHDESVATMLGAGDERGLRETRYHRALTLRKLGRNSEAYEQLQVEIPQILRVSPDWAVTVAEDYGAVLAELGEHERAVRLLGAAEAARERDAEPRPPTQEVEIEEPFAKARSALSAETWQRTYETGRTMTVEDALTEARTGPPPGSGG